MSLLGDLKSGKHKLSLDELCRQLLNKGQMRELERQVPQKNSIGATSASVEEMGSARTTQLVILGDALITGIASKLKAGPEDTKGVLSVLLSRADHSIAGEGKAASDRTSGVVSKTLRSSLNVGGTYSDQQTARQQARAVDSAMLKGVVNLVTSVELQELPPGVKLSKINRISTYHVKSREEDGKSLRLQEFSGIGRGIVVPVDGAIAAHLEDRIATVVAHTDVDDAEHHPLHVCKSRKLQKEEKAAKAAAEEAERESRRSTPSTKYWEDEREQERATILKALADKKSESMLVCSKKGCFKTFTYKKRKDWEKHTATYGGAKRKATTAEMIGDRIGLMKDVEEARQDSSQLAARRLAFESEADVQENVVYEAGPAGLLVRAAESATRCDVAAFLAKPSLVTHVNGEPLANSDASESEVVIELVTDNWSQISYLSVNTLTLTFTVPPPEMPTRGWARIGGRADAMVLHKEQRQFITKQWLDDKNVSAPKVKELMDAFFVGREEMHMFESEILKFLQRIYRRVREGKAPDDDANAEVEELSDEEDAEGGTAMGARTSGGIDRTAGGAGRGKTLEDQRKITVRKLQASRKAAVQEEKKHALLQKHSDALPAINAKLLSKGGVLSTLTTGTFATSTGDLLSVTYQATA